YPHVAALPTIGLRISNDYQGSPRRSLGQFFQVDVRLGQIANIKDHRLMIPDSQLPSHGDALVMAIVVEARGIDPVRNDVDRAGHLIKLPQLTSYLRRNSNHPSLVTAIETRLGVGHQLQGDTMTPRDTAQGVQIRGHTDVGRHHVWVATAIALRMPDVIVAQLSSLQAQTQRKTTNGRHGIGPHGAHALKLPARVRWLLTTVGEDSHSVAPRKRAGENLGVSAMTSVIVKIMDHQRYVQLIHRFNIPRAAG